jgi:hypothetical protein
VSISRSDSTRVRRAGTPRSSNEADKVKPVLSVSHHVGDAIARVSSAAMRKLVRGGAGSSTSPVARGETSEPLPQPYGITGGNAHHEPRIAGGARCAAVPKVT